MLAIARQLSSDFFGLRRVCGFPFAARWLAQVARHLPTCIKRRDLQPADLAFGRGPVRAKLGDAEAQLIGNCVVTGMREIWVRDCYLGDGFLTIPDSATVVDLGANIGVFTMLALAQGTNVRAIAVEPNHDAARFIEEAARLNGFQDRLQVCRAFLGGRTSTQDELAAMTDYTGSAFISEDEFVRRYNLAKIDFLKCDIEGSEFQLLTPASKLLAMSRQLSIELHTAMGDTNAFAKMLESLGFEVVVRHSSPHDCVLNARRRS